MQWALLLMQNSCCTMRKAGHLIWIFLTRVSDIFFAGQKWSRVYKQFKGRDASHNYVKIFICAAVLARRKTEISVTEMPRIVPYEHSSPVNRDETFQTK